MNMSGNRNMISGCLSLFLKLLLIIIILICGVFIFFAIKEF